MPGTANPLTQFGVFMLQVQQTCSCGKKYWPSQAWIHNGCNASGLRYADPDMANTASTDVANKTYRYRDPEKRRAYQREYMRKRRVPPSG